MKKPKTKTIGETVWQAQDTLVRMGRGKVRVDRKWGIAVTLQEVRLQYPKSLGELCLEIANDESRRCIELSCPYPRYLYGKGRASVLVLRRILYHGDTDSRIAAWAELDGPKWEKPA
jgi:hypothetical protein